MSLRSQRQPGPATPASEAYRWTIVIPTRERAHLIHRALVSVTAQDHPHWEVVVVDDGSEEDIRGVVQSFADGRIRYHRTEGVGGAAARNAGVACGSGDWVTFLDSDDEALPNWLSTLSAAAHAQGADIVCGGYLDRTVQPSRVVLPGDLAPLFPGVVGRFTKAGSFGLRRRVFDDVGGYAPDLKAGQHTELSFRILGRMASEGWRLTHAGEPLVVIHDHEGPRIRRDPEAVRSGALYVIEHHADLLGRCPRNLAAYHAVAGVNSARCGDRRDARRHLLKAVQAYPLGAKNWLRLGYALTPRMSWRGAQS